MTKVQGLKAVGGVLALAAVATVTHVWGEPAGDKTKLGRIEAPPAKVERNFTDDLAHTKFTNRSLVVYQTQAGDSLFALQVKPALAANAPRERDLTILVDTSASQARGPLATARKLTEALVGELKAGDRVSIWTVNLATATQSLTRGLKPANSADVKDALKALADEVPVGANDLKNAVEKAIAGFDNREGRQRVIVYLGSGKSLVNPITNADRLALGEKMTAKEIGFFPVPLGAHLEPTNLHGLATATGGLLVRHQAEEPVASTLKKVNEAVAAPILYTKDFSLGNDVVEFYPTKLPPVRGDAPTLVVGKFAKPGAKLDYTVKGAQAGRDVKITTTENVPAAEIDNFFLIGMVDQWKVADRKEAASPFRADRALAMSQMRSTLQRDEFVAQGHWAIELDRFDVAAQLFAAARKIDPADADADAGARIVDKLRNGLLTKDQLKNGGGVGPAGRPALGKPEDPAIRIQGKGKLTRDRMDKMVVLAEEDKMPAPGANPAAGNNDANFPPDREPFLRLQQQRQAVEEQRITGLVNEAERQARRILASDPETAHDVLKRTLASVRDNADLTPQTRQRLTNRLEDALRNVDTQGVRIKRDLDERLRLEADARARIARITEEARTEESIQRRIQAFNQLMNTGRVEEAHREALVLEADTIARGGSIKSVMVAAHDMGINAIHIKEQAEIRRASEENYLRAMLQVDKSHIPFPDEPPVGFPPASIWRELTNRRKGLWESVGLGEDAAGRAAANRIKEKLATPVNLDKGIDANTPLKDALEFLADRYDLTLIIDSKAFEAIGVQKVEEQPVQLPKMVGVSMTTVLRLLLAQIKGDVYTGTYLVRRDYIEVTTSYNAAAEKIIRAYPVADLVIPIPNAVNQQALQTSLAVYGQFQNAQNPAQFGIFGIGGGFGVGGVGGNPFAAPGMAPGAFPGGFNPTQLGGGGVGNNQFGNLGGQFGLQGGDTSRELLELIVKVVAPGEWQPLGAAPAQLGAPGGPPPGLGGPDPLAMDPIVPRELLNSLDYYGPARALIVRGSSRLHANLEGGLLGPRPGAPPAAMGAAPGVRNDGALVIRPGMKDNVVAKAPPKDDRPAMVQQVNSKKDWQAVVDKMVRDNPKADHAGLIIACADFLVGQRKFDHAAELLKANLRVGIVTRPWVYEALGVALQLSGGSPDDIERAQVSAVDVEPQDAKGYLRAAQAMADLKRHDRAVAFCRQAALMEPGIADPFVNGLVYAQEGKDAQAMAWAAAGLLKQDWPLDNDDLHNRARSKMADLARQLEQTARKADAEQMQALVADAKQRDLVIRVKWQGDADFDLKVKEPTGTVCSYTQKQTPNGGTLLGDDLSNLNHKQYVAAQAFPGAYDITVERVWGRPLGAKVTVEIIQHQGTADERIDIQTLVIDKTNKLTVALDKGRRTSVASVPPPSANDETVREDKAANPDRVLNKLRAMADPTSIEATGLRGGGFRSTGVVKAKPGDIRAVSAAATDPSKTPAFQKVNSFVGNALDMTAQTTVVPEKGEIRMRLTPVFQSAGKNAPAANPLIPGGF